MALFPVMEKRGCRHTLVVPVVFRGPLDGATFLSRIGKSDGRTWHNFAEILGAVCGPATRPGAEGGSLIRQMVTEASEAQGSGPLFGCDQISGCPVRVSQDELTEAGNPIGERPLVGRTDGGTVLGSRRVAMIDPGKTILEGRGRGRDADVHVDRNPARRVRHGASRSRL